MKEDLPVNTVETTPYGPARQRLVIIAPVAELTYEEAETIRDNATKSLPGVDILVIPAGYTAT